MPGSPNREILMTAPWDLPDFDDHEGVHLFRDARTGLTAIIAIHSTHLGPAAGKESSVSVIGSEPGAGLFVPRA